MHDETIDFSSACEAIEDLLRLMPDDLEHLTDLHVQSGKASARARGGVRAVELGSVPIDLAVSNIASLTAAALRREISPFSPSPILEQRIPPRYRVTCWHPVVVQDGHWVMSLRLLAEETIPLEQWVADGFLSSKDHERLVWMMGEPITILFAGTMGAGKTQLLRACLQVMPEAQRLIVLEDAAELNVQRANSVSLQTSHSIDLSRLISSAFRADAERVVVGEIRDQAAMQFLTLAAGGTRALTTIHTEPTIGALVRLHQMVLQGGYHVTIEQVRQAIHAVVTVQRMPDGRRQVEVLELGS